MAERKSKLIKKYMGEVKAKRKSYAREGLVIHDREEMEIDSSFSEESEVIREGGRIPDSED